MPSSAFHFNRNDYVPVGHHVGALQALEEKFPETAVMPEDKAEYDTFMERFPKVSMIIYKMALGSMPDPEPLQELQGFLEYADQVAARHEGDFLFGEFSAADMATAAFLPLVLQIRQGLDLAAYPHLVKALRALESRPSYQQTAVDFGTRKMVAAGFLHVGGDAVRA